MSELIDRSVLKARIYSAAFESDTDMQRWDSGCWIRYKLFENIVDNMPTVPYTPRWRRVEDELPDKTTTVLVWVGVNCDGMGMYPEMRTALWHTVSKHFFVHHDESIRGPIIGNVTHWMPIEPPKEDADADK